MLNVVSPVLMSLRCNFYHRVKYKLLVLLIYQTHKLAIIKSGLIYFENEHKSVSNLFIQVLDFP